MVSECLKWLFFIRYGENEQKMLEKAKKLAKRIEFFDLWAVFCFLRRVRIGIFCFLRRVRIGIKSEAAGIAACRFG